MPSELTGKTSDHFGLSVRDDRMLAAAARLRRANEDSDRQERQAALRALLRRPILPATGDSAEDYRLVWRNADALREWLRKMTGWTLHVQGELARLRKTPNACDDPTRAARDGATGQPFTRRRYAVLCLILAVIESEERQTTLGVIAERTGLLAGSDARLRDLGFQFDLTTQECRRDIVGAIRLLVELAVMSRDDGDDEEFVRGTGDALYRIHRPVLAALLCVSRAPSTLPPMHWRERLAALHEREAPDSDEAQIRRIRHQVVRRLLEQPVLYFDQLTEQELAYLTSQRSYLLGEIEEATGLLPEIRREGIALLDETGDLSDVGLPEAGTLGHATLLLAEWLAARLREGAASVDPREIDEQMAHFASAHREHWKRGVEQPAIRRGLTQDVLHRLESLGLIELRSGQVVPRPAIARFALKEPA